MELPIGATEENFIISKEIVTEYVKELDVDKYALKLLNLVYSKGGDYSETALRAFAKSYFNDYKNSCIFRKVKLSEIPQIFNLILERMKWMDEKGIKQWNVMEYDKVYPLSYYEEMSAKLYVLADDKDREILCAAVLLEEDDRWDDTEPAIYIHNLVSKAGSDSGYKFLSNIEELAKSKNKKYIRLDSSKDNEGLTKFYEKFGFEPAGACSEGPYRGILRQKRV